MESYATKSDFEIKARVQHWNSYASTLHNLRLRPCLVHNFEHMFLVFKQHYTYLHTLFHSHVFPKKLKTVV